MRRSIILFLFLATPALAGNVGFARFEIADGPNPPIAVAVWYPTTATPAPNEVGVFTQTVAPDAPIAGRNLPMVVISHGHGGVRTGHADTALALAESGFVAAALTHTGDNYRDDSRALDLVDRARQLHVLIEAMLTHWGAGTIDSARIGAFGFSAGGFTVLAAAGGEPDLRLVAPHCAAHPTFYDCTLLAAGHPPPPSPVVHDPHIRALVVAAPALGFTFAPSGLKNVKIPVQLWRAANDQILPSPFYAEPVAASLPTPPEQHTIPNAGHFDFLAPCTKAFAEQAPPICTSAPNFNRTDFHKTFDAAVTLFFARNLKPR